MQAHNLCYSTLIQPEDVHKLDPSAYGRSPVNCCFVKHDTQPGILPAILAELLGARKRAKGLMKAEKAKGDQMDELTYAVYDGRQLALKVSANSVYGFTGAQVGALPCLEISKSVTSYGRGMIDATKNMVETYYTKANGFDHDAIVVYGDTDSVMIRFGCPTVGECITLGLEAADRATALFLRPIKLEWEKVYYPYLLMNKKRYAGMYYTHADYYDYMDAKGIEIVRRDNCQLTKDVVGNSLRLILIKRDPAAALAYVKEQIGALLGGTLDMSKLIITKGLNKTADEYKGSKMAHVELAARMKIRDAGSAPNVGDRINFIMIKGEKGSKAFENAEDPAYILDNGLTPDADWYLLHQIKEPLKRIFMPIVEEINSLFEGDHTRRVKKIAPTKGGLISFSVATARCVACNCLLTHRNALCDACTPDMEEHYIRINHNRNTAEHMTWSTAVAAHRQQNAYQKDLSNLSKTELFFVKRLHEKNNVDLRKTLTRFPTPTAPTATTAPTAPTAPPPPPNSSPPSPHLPAPPAAP